MGSSPERGAGPSDRPRPLAILKAGLTLAVLLGTAVLFILPDIPLDADVLKLSVLALLVAPIAIMVVALRDPGAVRDWFGSTGGRLYLGSILYRFIRDNARIP